jgi:hypothetical protein
VDFRCPTIHQSQLVQAHSNAAMQIARSVSLQVNSLSFHLVKKIPGHVRIGRGTPDWNNFANCWAVSGGYGLVTLSLSLLCSLPMPLFDLAGRVTSARGVLRVLWLSGGAVAMAIWYLHALHRDAAFRLTIPIQYDCRLSWFTSGCHSHIGNRVICRQPRGDGIQSSHCWQCLHG